MKSEAITLVIAAWGAVLASITFGWNLFRDLSDRGKLKVTCDIRMIVQPGVGIEKENVLSWYVTNVGRRPVLLIKIGGRTTDREFSHFVVQTRQVLPKMLQPGEYFTDYMDDYSNLNVDGLRQLYAYDSLGRTYKAPRKQVKKVRGELVKIVSRSPGEV